MEDIKIKAEFVKKKLAFGQGAKSLSERSQEELRDLAIIGLDSKDQSILRLFEGKLPAVAELKADQFERLGVKPPAPKADAKPKLPTPPDSNK